MSPPRRLAVVLVDRESFKRCLLDIQAMLTLVMPHAEYFLDPGRIGCLSRVTETMRMRHS